MPLVNRHCELTAPLHATRTVFSVTDSIVRAEPCSSIMLTQERYCLWNAWTKDANIKAAADVVPPPYFHDHPLRNVYRISWRDKHRRVCTGITKKTGDRMNYHQKDGMTGDILAAFYAFAAFDCSATHH